MIGIFDSGVGGLSVLKEICRLLPEEDCIYYADNAHCPYGEKSREYIIERAREISRTLISGGADIIVVACNTATAAAISVLRKEFSFPDNAETRSVILSLSGGRHDHIMFIGMEPAIKPAALSTSTGVIGVLATAGTLKGDKYLNIRDKFADEVRIVEHVGSGFVELVESGRTEGEETERTIKASLKPLLDAGADVIVLGCTHYPFLMKTIMKTASDMYPERRIRILDPAPAIARHLKEVMVSEGILYKTGREGILSDRFQDTGNIFQLPYGNGRVELLASGNAEGLIRTFNYTFAPELQNTASRR